MADALHEYAVIDVETTGVYFRKNRVVSVAVAHCDGAGVILDEWYSLVNPECPMDATHIHGITDEAVADAPHFGAITDELLGLLGGAVLIGHNVNFDWNFLSFEFARAGVTLPAHDAICTMGLAQVLGTPTANYKLDSLAAFCEVPLPRAAFHDAREDVRAAAGVFARLYPLALSYRIDVTKHLNPVVPPHVRKTSPCDYVNPGRAVAGQPLVQGMHFAITGDTVTPREELVARAGTVGLDFTNHTVTAKTSFVLANDRGSGTTTVEKAQHLGTLVIDEPTFLVLLDTVQPGTRRDDVVARAEARKAARPARTQSVGLEAAGPLAGRRTVILGQIEDRDALAELITANGGTVAPNVTKNVSLVVAGPHAEADRLETARGFGAEVLSPEELQSRLHAGDVLAVSGPVTAAAPTQAMPVPEQTPAVTAQVSAPVADRPAPAPVAQLPPPGWNPEKPRYRPRSGLIPERLSRRSPRCAPESGPGAVPRRSPVGSPGWANGD